MSNASADPAAGADPAGTLAHLPALWGEYFPIASEETGRAYHIYIRTPEGYDPLAATQYPAVYVLDGDSLFPILAANHLFLTYDDAMPEAVIIGIAYGSFDPSINRRDVDFMPPGAEVETGGAGAEAFQRFLKSELMPAVEARYRIDPTRRILFGQSRGGSFVLYSAFTEPDLFWGRIASNPAFAPTHDFFAGAPAPAKKSDGGLFISSGSADYPALRADALAWAPSWEGRQDRPWDFRLETIEGGTHAANSTDAYRAGLRWLFNREAPLE
jgi:predicted alpha/beta superfamily hydrolase